MLKRSPDHLFHAQNAQPPSGGCVLKHIEQGRGAGFARQPPSGGCVLKHGLVRRTIIRRWPAAFGRLCVETTTEEAHDYVLSPSRLRAAVC